MAASSAACINLYKGLILDVFKHPMIPKHTCINLYKGLIQLNCLHNETGVFLALTSIRD